MAEEEEEEVKEEEEEMIEAPLTGPALSGLCFFMTLVFSWAAARRIFSSRVSWLEVLVGEAAGVAAFDEAG